LWAFKSERPLLLLLLLMLLLPALLSNFIVCRYGGEMFRACDVE
jgi:hypothetical protein